MSTNHTQRETHGPDHRASKPHRPTRTAFGIATALFCSITLSYSAPSLAWGQTGHRVTGAIATEYLTADTKQAIRDILGHESLAQASTYPDEMRSSPDPFWRKTASPYHYVTLKQPPHYHDHDAPAEGDSVTALTHFRGVLLNPKSSKAQQQLALRFIVHIIGDLHQPLHVSDAALADLGGNKFSVTYFRAMSNLHKVWDSEMIDSQQLSYSEMTQWLLAEISQQERQQWQQTNPKVWIQESSELRLHAYAAAKQAGAKSLTAKAAANDAAKNASKDSAKNAQPQNDIAVAVPDLSYDHNYSQYPVVKLRLKQGGVRIADYLNELFAERAKKS